MNPNISYPQPPFTHAIKLYGDRDKGKPCFKFAGFAWIHNTKVIFGQGNRQGLSNSSEWRSLLRLAVLAQRLKKPIVLWNPPITHITETQRHTTLAHIQVIQKIELELLKLPHPIITVFDTNYDETQHVPKLIWNDGVVLLQVQAPQLSGEKKIKIVEQPLDTAAAILELLCELEAVPATELIKNRRESLQFLAKN